MLVMKKLQRELNKSCYREPHDLC